MVESAFDPIIGNVLVKSYLSEIVRKNRAGNSWLFTGPEGIGKMLFAKAFAKLLSADQYESGRRIDQETHPDFHIYRPEGKIGLHSIQSMRDFGEKVYLAPFEGKWKVFVINDAERMLPSSANALLKTFEEPASDAVIILVSHEPTLLLPTVLSRCRTVHFQPLQTAEIEAYLELKFQIPREEARKLALLSYGSLGRAIRLHQGKGMVLRTLILDFLSSTSDPTYKELTALSSEIGKHIDSMKEELTEGIQKSLRQNDNGSAVQKQYLEKEVEGMLSILVTREAHTLFEVIFEWYRDLHLHSVNGSKDLLIHADYRDRSSQMWQRGKILSLDFVQKSLKEAVLALQRSTSIQLCFENLFLKLK